MSRTLVDTRSWVKVGTELVHHGMEQLAAPELDEPTALPTWTRRHVLAHLAANADALRNLVHWAATGEPTPMYASAQARQDGIERGLSRAPEELQDWVSSSAAALDRDMDALDEASWQHNVMTAQGRTVPATEIPWLRSREVCVHGVDLAAAARFSDLPDSFLTALVDDIVVKRGMSAADLPEGPLPEVTAWLAGRPYNLPHVAPLGPWL